MAFFLVSGGAGFIGSHLVDALLQDGHRVRVLDNLSTGRLENVPSHAELVVGDIGSPATVSAAMRQVDGCFHLAAVASVERCNEDWPGTHRTNLGGTVAVLDAARARGGVPVVYASSAAVYGDVPGRAAERCRPLTAYGADKLGSELHARVAWLVHGVPTIGLRFFNVFGPRQDPSSPYSGVISVFARLLHTGRPLSVHGDGLQSRDIVYVGDVVMHLLAAMRHAQVRTQCKVLKMCTGNETNLLQLASLLGRATHRTPELRHGPARVGDIRRSVGAPDQAVAKLGVRARTNLGDGLAATIASLSASAIAIAIAIAGPPTPWPVAVHNLLGARGTQAAMPAAQIGQER